MYTFYDRIIIIMLDVLLKKYTKKHVVRYFNLKKGETGYKRTSDQ